MCAVIDPPLFVKIFKKSDADHINFKKLNHHLTKGNGKIVYGGKKYRDELIKIASIIPILAELERARKIVKINDDVVARSADYAKSIAHSTDFDDEHLIGILDSTSCGVICINDPRAHRFIKNRSLYMNRGPRPKIYKDDRNAALLSSHTWPACCN